jgi:hypothetical protein
MDKKKVRGLDLNGIWADPAPAQLLLLHTGEAL